MAISQSQREAAIRWAGAVVALAAASMLTAMGFPAVEVRVDVTLALHAILLLGCAAVLLSPAHGAVAGLVRRATEAAWGMAALGAGFPLRWLGFAGIVVYALYVTGDVASRKETAADAAWPDAFQGFLFFLMFLAGVWAVYLSMVWAQSGQPLRLSAGAVAEEDPDGEEVEVKAMPPARVVVDSKL